MQNTATTKIDNFGRVLVPSEWRSKLHLKKGDHVILVLESDGAIRMISRSQATKEIHDIAKKYKTKSGSIVDEFLQERREEPDNE